MDIKVLGSGCHNCQALERETVNALAEMDIAANVEKVTDFMKIAEYGVLATPALVVNGRVKVSGRVPRRDEIKAWLTEEMKTP